MRRVVTDFGGFAKDFESYAADQFSDREQLIGVYTALELAQGKKFARKAYCLQDSWLLTKPTPTKPADLSALQQALAQAGALDRPLVWCVLPLKNEALYDLEPAYFSDETGETNKQALTAALAQVEGDTVFLKYTYSCLSHTELETWLKKKRIRTLIICGTVTNWCVDSTIREAYHKDYNVVAVADCISSYDHCGRTADDWNSAMFDLWAEMFGRVMTAEQVEAEIEAASAK